MVTLEGRKIATGSPSNTRERPVKHFVGVAIRREWEFVCETFDQAAIGTEVILHAASNATSSNSWKLSVISVLSLSACVVASPAKVASMAALNDAKSGWYLP